MSWCGSMVRYSISKYLYHNITSINLSFRPRKTNSFSITWIWLPRTLGQSVRISLLFKLIPTLSAWPLRGHWALKSILWETLFLDKLHDFSLLFLDTFLHPFLNQSSWEKIPWYQKNQSRSPIFINKYIYSYSISLSLLS